MALNWEHLSAVCDAQENSKCHFMQELMAHFLCVRPALERFRTQTGYSTLYLDQVEVLASDKRPTNSN